MKPMPTTIQPGATHWNRNTITADWYKKHEGAWLFYDRFSGRWMACTASDSFINELIPVQELIAQESNLQGLKISSAHVRKMLDNNRFGVTVPEWSGDGLPPVGTECEVSMSTGMFGAPEWLACTVLVHDIGAWEIAVFKTKAGVYGGATWDFFRPLKTEREKAIQAMNPIICSQGMFSADGDACKAISAALYDAGYRKVEK
jgi:hypothetical protein